MKKIRQRVLCTAIITALTASAYAQSSSPWPATTSTPNSTTNSTPWPATSSSSSTPWPASTNTATTPSSTPTSSPTPAAPTAPLGSTSSISTAVPASSDSSGATTATSTATTASGDSQPKFYFWGMLLNFAFKFAMQALGEWLKGLINDITDPASLTKVLANTASATIDALSSTTPFDAKSAYLPENTVAGSPTTPISVKNGRENFQGVHIAVVGFDQNGKPTGVKPVTAGFATGERIRLKVLPTFNGILVIENINPKGERTQIYPSDASKVVSIKAGKEIFVPIGTDEYFEFAGDVGDEQLVVTLRDPRAFGSAASSAQANRKDDATGSNFVQETPVGTFPVISQSLKFNHNQ